MDLYPAVEAMLGANGIGGPETPIVGGYSGARLSTLETAGQRYILKRVRFSDDWIMQETLDGTYREVQFAISDMNRGLPRGIRTPYIAASHDGEGRALLMHDISALLIKDDVVAPAVLDTILVRVAELHAFGLANLPHSQFGWCDLHRRLSYLSPEAGRRLVDNGHDFGLARGWATFERIAPPEAVGLVERLRRDPVRLHYRLAGGRLLHGDLKIDNMGLDPDGRMWLFDWALVSRGTVAVDVGWFLAVNSSRLPWSFEEILQCYESHLRAALGPRFDDEEWMTGFRGIAIVGLLLYGWGKALDAESGRPDELHWWCEKALHEAEALGL